MAAMYRSQIADLLSRLANNTASAREWRTVADNRLALLAVMDSAIAAVYSSMLVTESKTSVKAFTTEVPLADANVHSADEICRFSLERLKCCAMYLGALRSETASLQTLLLETLNDGLQLLSVQRPSCDLRVSEYPEMMSDEASEPEVNGGGPAPEDTGLGDTSPIAERNTSSSLAVVPVRHATQAMALFFDD
jgi:hypothetical protein